MVILFKEGKTERNREREWSRRMIFDVRDVPDPGGSLTCILPLCLSVFLSFFPSFSLSLFLSFSYSLSFNLYLLHDYAYPVFCFVVFVAVVFCFLFLFLLFTIPCTRTLEVKDFHQFPATITHGWSHFVFLSRLSWWLQFIMNWIR